MKNKLIILEQFLKPFHSHTTSTIPTFFYTPWMIPFWISKKKRKKKKNYQPCESFVDGFIELSTSFPKRKKKKEKSSWNLVSSILSCLKAPHILILSCTKPHIVSFLIPGINSIKLYCWKKNKIKKNWGKSLTTPILQNLVFRTWISFLSSAREMLKKKACNTGVGHCPLHPIHLLGSYILQRLEIQNFDRSFDPTPVRSI